MSEIREENIKLKEIIKVLEESNSYYGNIDNWVENDHRNNLYDITQGIDVDYVKEQALSFGGKRAREAQKRVKEIREGK